MSGNSLELRPCLIEEGALDAFIAQNRTVTATIGPRANSIAVFATPNIVPHPKHFRRAGTKESQIWFAQWESVSHFRRKFIVESYLSFQKFQNEILPFRQAGREVPLLSLYDHADSLVKLMDFHLDLASNSTTGSENEDLIDDMSLFHFIRGGVDLVRVMYCPSHQFVQPFVGMDLLHWLNLNYLYDTEEALDTYVNQKEPWKYPSFWSFIKQCVLRLIVRPVEHFFHQMRDQHPSAFAREVATQLCEALDDIPLPADVMFAADEFIERRQLWKAKLHLIRRTFDKHTQAKYEGKEEMLEILNLFDGDEEVMCALIEQSGYGWRETICVYGVWVHPTLVREELPGVVSEIIKRFPMDLTVQEEALHEALISGDAIRAMAIANELDPWFAAHMSDLLQNAILPEIEIDRMRDLRQYFLLNYAEHLMADPSLWRLVSDYLVHCGIVGRDLLNQYLSQLPFRLPRNPSQPLSHFQQLEGAEDGSDDSPSFIDLEELINECEIHSLYEARQVICKTAAKSFAESRQYGRAVELCGQIDDIKGLSRIIETLLGELFGTGPREFIAFVDEIPAKYLYPHNSGMDPTEFTSELFFVTRYAEYHHFRSEGKRAEAASCLVDIFTSPTTPQAWWGLLLLDAGDLLEDDEEMVFRAGHISLLLERLDEVCTQTKHGARDDYLRALVRSLPSHSEIDALQQLDGIRYALIRYKSKCTGEAGGSGPLVPS